MGFAASTLYRSWAQRLRLPINKKKGRAWLGAIATLLGDMTLDWGTQALYEHFPEYASATSLGLIGSERQIDQGPNETNAAYGSRLTFATQLWRFAGTPIGMLVALHFAGFDNVVIVQQNGMAYQLQLPLPLFISGQAWDPTPNLIRTPTSMLDVALASSVSQPTASSAGRAIPLGNSWWTFDSNTDFCTRFCVLFPGPLPSMFMTWGRATFVNASSAPVVWNNVFTDTSYSIQVGAITVNTAADAGVFVWADNSTKTPTGATLRSDEAFNGTVDVLAYPAGSNPYANLSGASMARLLSAIKKWRPGKATCTGVYALLQGSFIGWPVNTIGNRPPSFSVVTNITGSF